jgi:penicillin-binding protein 1A
MSQAVKGAAPRAVPLPKPKPDPEGPIEPLDLPELPDIPVDIEGTDVRIDQGEGVTVNTEVGGVPLEVNFGREGVNVQSKERNPPETR